MLAAVVVMVTTIGIIAVVFSVRGLKRATELNRRADELTFIITLISRQLRIEQAAAARRWWVVLGIAQSASRMEINAAYRARLKAVHPDLGGNGDVEVIDCLRRARRTALRETLHHNHRYGSRAPLDKHCR